MLFVVFDTRGDCSRSVSKHPLVPLARFMSSSSFADCFEARSLWLVFIPTASPYRINRSPRSILTIPKDPRISRRSTRSLEPVLRCSVFSSLSRVSWRPNFVLSGPVSVFSSRVSALQFRRVACWLSSRSFALRSPLHRLIRFPACSEELAFFHLIRIEVFERNPLMFDLTVFDSTESFFVSSGIIGLLQKGFWFCIEIFMIRRSVLSTIPSFFL
jgi:hypothetical protein